MGIGGLVAFASVLSAPAMLLLPEMDMGLRERLVVLLCSVMYAAIFVGIYRLGAKLTRKFAKEVNGGATEMVSAAIEFS